MSIVYTVYVDWDAVDWKATPDFSEGIDNISAYVKRYFTDRGKSVELGNIPAGSLDLVLDNSDKRFSAPYAAGPLYGKIRPWLPVIIQGEVAGGGAVTFFTGFISRLTVNPHEDVQEAYMYITDGIDLLARNMVTLNDENRRPLSDGQAVGKILNSAGWPSTKRNIDVDTGAILEYPSATEY